MFYNPIYSQEEENFAMIASCSYYRPTKKAFDWLTEIKDDNRFGFRLITAYNQTQVHRQNSTEHGITKTKNNKNHGEKRLQRN